MSSLIRSLASRIKRWPLELELVIDWPPDLLRSTSKHGTVNNNYWPVNGKFKAIALLLLFASLYNLKVLASAWGELWPPSAFWLRRSPSGSAQDDRTDEMKEQPLGRLRVEALASRRQLDEWTMELNKHNCRMSSSLAFGVQHTKHIHLASGTSAQVARAPSNLSSPAGRLDQIDQSLANGLTCASLRPEVESTRPPLKKQTD